MWGRRCVDSLGMCRKMRSVCAYTDASQGSGGRFRGSRWGERCGLQDLTGPDPWEGQGGLQREIKQPDLRHTNKHIYTQPKTCSNTQTVQCHPSRSLVGKLQFKIHFNEINTRIPIALQCQEVSRNGKNIEMRTNGTTYSTNEIHKKWHECKFGSKLERTLLVSLWD